MTPRFASVVLDVDSTLTGIEGIDWLAARRGRDVAVQVAALTETAMSGAVALEQVYTRRLELIRPTADDVAQLADAYRAALAPGAAEALDRLRAAGVVASLVSGGLREAILPMAAELGFAPGAVHAVAIRFSATGEYLDVDKASPLVVQTGKATVVRSLNLPAPVLAVGDGSTDAAMRPAAGAFAAYTGIVRRESVVRAADYVVASFAELVTLVLG